MGRFLWLWAIGAFGLALFSPLASSLPDGLEKVAEVLGFVDKEKEPLFKLMPDYLFPWVENEPLATVVAGLIGVALVLGGTYLLAKALRQKT